MGEVPSPKSQRNTDAFSMQEALNSTVVWVVIFTGDQVKHGGAGSEQEAKVYAQKMHTEIMNK